MNAETIRRMGELFENREKMSPSEILDELESIHESGGIPMFPRDPEWRDLWYYRIMGNVRKSPDLRPTDVDRMLKILDWPYYEQPGGVNFEILHAAERFPSAQIRAGLETFLERVRGEMEKEGPGTHLYADLATQVRILETLIPKCV